LAINALTLADPANVADASGNDGILDDLHALVEAAIVGTVEPGPNREWLCIDLSFEPNLLGWEIAG
jgi:hypothetical protein